MKQIKIYYSIILMFLCSCSFLSIGQEFSNYEIVQKGEDNIDVFTGQGYRLNDNFFLGFLIDEINIKTGEWYKNLMCYSKADDWTGKKLSQVDLSDGHYSDTLIFYINSLSGNQVIMWKKEGEYWSYIDIFLFTGSSIDFLTDIAIGLDCSSCDAFNFPVRDILVKESENMVEIVFTSKVIYRGSESQNVRYHSVNIDSKKFKILYHDNRTTISY